MFSSVTGPGGGEIGLSPEEAAVFAPLLWGTRRPFTVRLCQVTYASDMHKICAKEEKKEAIVMLKQIAEDMGYIFWDGEEMCYLFMQRVLHPRALNGIYLSI